MRRKKVQKPVTDIQSQDWSDLVQGQRVWLRQPDGETVAAVVELKTSNSTAVWVIRDDFVQTRHVFSHNEGVQIFPIDEQPAAPNFGPQSTDPAPL